jgi:hypothetical protein
VAPGGVRMRMSPRPTLLRAKSFFHKNLVDSHSASIAGEPLDPDTSAFDWTLRSEPSFDGLKSQRDRFAAQIKIPPCDVAGNFGPAGRGCWPPRVSELANTPPAAWKPRSGKENAPCAPPPSFVAAPEPTRAHSSLVALAPRVGARRRNAEGPSRRADRRRHWEVVRVGERRQTKIN